MIGKKLQKALGLAVEELKRRRHEYLTLEHVLYGIASEPSGRKLIERCGGSAPVLRQALDHFFKTYMESLDEPTKDVYQTLAVQRVLDSALAHVKSAGRDEDIGVEVGDVLAAILEEEEYSWAAYCLKKQGITRLAVLESISHNDEEGQDESSSESGEGEGGAESAKDALARYTVDLTARAREGKLDPLVGREMELSRSIEILARRRKNNPLYVGDPGTGKTAIAEGLALRIVSGNVPPEFKDTKIYSLDLGAVLAGARYRGDFEGRIKAVVGALQKIPGAILFIDEIHRLNKVAEEILYPAMEDFAIDIMIGKGASARSIRLDLPKFTLVGATTRAGLLSAPLRDRFGVTQRLEFYDKKELTTIILRSAQVLGVDIEPKGAAEIAKRSRGTPRLANRLLKRVRDFAQVKYDGVITYDVACFALDLLEVDQYGLDKTDRRILQTLILNFQGGPVGLETLAASIGEDSGTLEDVYEPYLLQNGFLNRTPRGRMASVLAYTHLGYPRPDISTK